MAKSLTAPRRHFSGFSVWFSGSFGGAAAVASNRIWRLRLRLRLRLQSQLCGKINNIAMIANNKAIWDGGLSINKYYYYLFEFVFIYFHLFFIYFPYVLQDLHRSSLLLWHRLSARFYSSIPRRRPIVSRGGLALGGWAWLLWRGSHVWLQLGVAPPRHSLGMKTNNKKK